MTEVITNSEFIDGTRMKRGVFEVMTATEDAVTKEYIIKQMQEKDAINKYPYTISTDRWLYKINRAIDKYGNDYTDEYGTQYTATQKHK